MLTRGKVAPRSSGVKLALTWAEAPPRTRLFLSNGRNLRPLIGFGGKVRARIVSRQNNEIRSQTNFWESFFFARARPWRKLVKFKILYDLMRGGVTQRYASARNEAVSVVINIPSSRSRVTYHFMASVGRLMSKPLFRIFIFLEIIAVRRSDAKQHRSASRTQFFFFFQWNKKKWLTFSFIISEAEASNQWHQTECNVNHFLFSFCWCSCGTRFLLIYF